jgi:hypothetical protein
MNEKKGPPFAERRGKAFQALYCVTLHAPSKLKSAALAKAVAIST